MVTRADALNMIRSLPSEVREAIALVVETAETQGGYVYAGVEVGTVWEDSVNETLSHLACEIRSL